MSSCTMDNVHKRHSGPDYDVGRIQPDHRARLSTRHTRTFDALGCANYEKCQNDETNTRHSALRNTL